MLPPLSVHEVEYWPDTAVRVQGLAAQPWFVFLDSCHAAGGGRYDIVAWQPETTLVTRGALTAIASAGHTEISSADPFALVQEQLEREPRHAELPFCGGAIGLFAYDLGRRLERLPENATRDIDVPEMAVGIYSRSLVVDHLAERAWFVHRDLAPADVASTCVALTVTRTLTPAVFATRYVVTSTVRPDRDFAHYARSFARIKHYIREGDCYQVNFAQRFAAAASGDPWDAYLRLRNRNPAPYAAFMRLPGAAVLCSSPERFVAVRGEAVETRPIKGTRARSSDPVRDRELADELAVSTKDRAENLMIVDLLRNDLGKHCAIGSVIAPRLFEIESFARVHHLVSTVEGRLAPGVRALDVLRGCFPGGSITGAPKLRAMEIIEELEPTRRGMYCGALGYVSHDGQMDTNIAIRSLLHYRDRLYCWAGGGIVMDSELEDEYQESLNKAAAMLSVFADAEGEHVGH